MLCVVPRSHAAYDLEMTVTDRRLESLSRRSAVSVVSMAFYRGDAHIASSLSVIDGLIAALNFIKSGQPLRKHRLFLSKGHAAPALYATMAEFGIIDLAELKTFNNSGTRLGIHPSRSKFPEAEYSSGSLGHGLALAAGVALGNRIRQNESFAIAVLGDGETNEGSIWEAAMFAANQKLTNLIALVDHNKVQSVARYAEVAGEMTLEGKFKAFGWRSITVSGNDADKIFSEILKYSEDKSRDKPLAIILDSMAGARVSCMEDQVLWHYRRPSQEEFQMALVELDANEIATDILEIFK